MITNNENAKTVLLKSGIKPTAQRISVLSFLLSTKSHPTIDEIFSALKKAIPTLSKTTLYNTLKLFEEKGVSLSLNIDYHKRRYDGFSKPHFHFLCKKCGRVFDILLKDISKIINSRHVNIASIETFHGYFYGICRNCKEERRNI